MYELGMKNKNKRWDDKKIEASVLTTKERKGKERKEEEVAADKRSSDNQEDQERHCNIMLCSVIYKDT